jgi:hypothetical protein
VQAAVLAEFGWVSLTTVNLPSEPKTLSVVVETRSPARSSAGGQIPVFTGPVCLGSWPDDPFAA